MQPQPQLQQPQPVQPQPSPALPPLAQLPRDPSAPPHPHLQLPAELAGLRHLLLSAVQQLDGVGMRQPPQQVFTTAPAVQPHAQQQTQPHQVPQPATSPLQRPEAGAGEAPASQLVAVLQEAVVREMSVLQRQLGRE